MRLRVCHDGKNPNGSAFEISDIAKAQNSIVNIPVLGHVIWDDDECPQFGGHDMHLEEDRVKDGEFRMIYDEIPIGTVPETNNYEIAEFDGKNYAYTDCYVWRKYSNYAEDIVERDKDIKLSMEIDVDSYTYDNRTNTYHILEYRHTGITFLGNDRGTGMENAVGMTYSSNVNKEQLYEMMTELKTEMQKINSSLSGENINRFEKEEKVLDEKLKLLETFNLQTDSLDFDINDYSLAELEAKLKEYVDANDGVEDNSGSTEEFALNGQFVDELIEKISVEKISSEWGEYAKYGYWDFDDTKLEVYAWDRTDYKLYGFTYEKSGDAVSIDFDSKKRMKIEVSDFVDGDISSDFELTVKDVCETISNSNTEKYEALANEFDDYKTKFSVPNEEVVRLQEFMKTTLTESHKQAVESVLGDFEMLAENEEFIALRETAYEFEDIELLREKCFAIKGKISDLKFESKPKQKEKTKVPVPEAQEITSAPYGGLFDLYGNK